MTHKYNSGADLFSGWRARRSRPALAERRLQLSACSARRSNPARKPSGSGGGGGGGAKTKRALEGAEQESRRLRLDRRGA